ncbi:MAG: 1-acyl-sn-glycerol-3-phosphate acyltransferase [Firmicutes bacterium]|nr:1-acyl-sn-glycerol-3-phosphate acyltransferase [Bacillota bacterium]
MKDEKVKRKPWVRKRHNIIIFLVYWAGWIMVKLMYGIRYDKQKDGRQYLILFNHQTPFDQFFPSLMFHGHVYYVASEDIISKGWVSRLLDFLVAPIPIKKQMTDLKAVRNILQVAKEGGTIGMAPEGNRTYSGLTCDINPACVKLAKKMGLPIAIVRFEGGYAFQPRWANERRRAKKWPWMEAKIARIIEPDELKAMSEDELFKAIKEGLWQDDAEYVKRTGQRYYHKRNAEYLERVLYVCPNCGLSSFVSEKCEVKCQKCGLTYTLLPDLTLEKTAGSITPDGTGGEFATIGKWFEWQQDYIRQLDLNTLNKDKPLYEDHGQYSHVVLESHKETLIEDAKIRLYPDRIEVDAGQDTQASDAYPTVFLFKDVLATSALGRNKLNIYLGKELYQIKSDARFNAVKYVNLFYRYKNMEKGDHSNEQFLGL